MSEQKGILIDVKSIVENKKLILIKTKKKFTQPTSNFKGF